MKTKLFLTLGALIGSCMIISAEDGPKKPDRPKRPLPAEILKEFDKDGDGKLSPEERDAMKAARDAKMAERKKEMLAKYDKDGDGKLSEDEKKAAQEDRKKEMLAKYDKDGDGELSKEEREAMPKGPRMPGEGRRKGPHGPGGKGGGPGGPPPGEAPPPPPAE